MKRILIVGGSGVMGTAAILAAREVFGANATIVANWFGKEDAGYKVDGADHTVFGDITARECLQAITAAGGKDYDYLCYATAMGEVGFPIKDATMEQIEHSHRLSFAPVPVLEGALNIGTVVTYSTFYLLKHQICSYGAMAYSKEALEKWTLQPGKSKRVCIRAGLFPSHSSRAIKLLLRKNAKSMEKTADPLLRSYFENVPASEGIQKFEEGIIGEERAVYGDSPTTAESLKAAHLTLFRTPDSNAVIINICGNKIWLTREALLLSSIGL